MNDLISIGQAEIGGKTVPTINARELHAFLQSGQEFRHWIRDRIEQYGFVRYADFITEEKMIRGGRAVDFHITIDMAKELAMVERNEQGKRARQYFIECERRALAPATSKLPQTFSEALRLAADLQDQVEQQAQQIAAAQPAIAFREAVADMTGTCKIEYIAQTLGFGRNTFFRMLRTDQILKDNRMPYQDQIDAGHFIVVARAPWEDSAGNTHPAFTTMVTGKGQIYLARKYKKASPAVKAAKAT